MIVLYISQTLIFGALLYIFNKMSKVRFLREIEFLHKQVNLLEIEKADLKQNLDLLNNAYQNKTAEMYTLLTAKEVLELKNQELQNKISEWESMREKTIDHAKAAIFEVGTKLSNKLFDDHKRETEAASKVSQKRMEEASQKFNSEFENIVKSVSILSEQIRESKKTVDIVKEALLTPTGAGNLSEITLENILKNSGLISGTDYKIQYNFSDNKSNLRPDAVVFLPSDNLMVIDSKASKFFTELVISENQEEVQKKVTFSMRSHIKTLISKDYINAIKNDFVAKNRAINNVSMVMFLPSEVALEKVQNLDPEFMEMAWQNHIYPTGPAGLVSILSNAKFQISQNNQVENYHKIIDEVAILIDNIANLYEHANKFGNSLQSTVNHFDKFAGTFNKYIITRTKNLLKYGIINKKKKVEKIDRYQMLNTTNLTVLDAEDESEKQLIDEEV